MDTTDLSFQEKFEKYFGKVTDEQWNEFYSSVKACAKMTHEIVATIRKYEVQSKEVSNAH